MHWCKCREYSVHPSGGRPHRAFLPVLSPQATGAVLLLNDQRRDGCPLPTGARRCFYRHPHIFHGTFPPATLRRLMRPGGWKRRWQRALRADCGERCPAEQSPFWQVDRYHTLGWMGHAN